MTAFRFPLLSGPLVAAALAITAGLATAAPLPGGASSLVETYDDWGVACQMQEKVPACVARQVQTNKQTNQTVLTIEIGKAQDGKHGGVLLLPLGLSLAQGAQLRIDEGTPGAAIAFTTCLPQGCLVPLDFSADMIAKLRVGKMLNINITAVNSNQPMTLAVSLKGLSNALNRIADLTK